MCVAFPFNPFPLLEWVLFISLGLLAVALALLLLLIYNQFSERKAGARESPRKSKPRWPLGNALSIFLSPWIWTTTMVVRPLIFTYSVIKRTFSSFTRWRTDKSTFDHEQLVHDSRWEKFWREKVLPVNSERLRSCIPLDLFPIVRQTQLGTVVAYSEQYVRNVFLRGSEHPQTTPRERFVLVLRGPRSEDENNTEPRFKDVVTDMLRLKQVRIISNFMFCSNTTLFYFEI